MLRSANSARGGTGRRQGRKPLSAGEESVTVSVRLTPAQRESLRTLGGASWVRQQLDGAMQPQPEPPSSEELMALSKECEKMPGGLGMFYRHYADAVLARWGR